MRILLVTLIVTACAAPALAQDPALDARYQAMWQEQQAANRLAQQRSVALENQVGALETQLQAEGRLRDLEAQRNVPRLSAPDAGKPATAIVLPSNIDAWMADSTARIRAAAANRR